VVGVFSEIALLMAVVAVEAVAEVEVRLLVQLLELRLLGLTSTTHLPPATLMP